MLGQTFYHQTIRKYVALFGTLFNDISIEKRDSDNQVTSKIKVPVSYGPKQKFLSRLQSDPNLDKQIAIKLPRIGFEMTGVNYDPERKLNSMGKITKKDYDLSGKRIIKSMYNPNPYNFDFSLSVFVDNAEDGTQILEQILPFFTPEFTVTVNIITDLGLKLDVPIILNSASVEDDYLGDFLQRRAIVWTLDFLLKGFIYPEIKSSDKIVKSVSVSFRNMSNEIDSESELLYLNLETSSNYSKSRLLLENGNYLLDEKSDEKLIEKNIISNIEIVPMGDHVEKTKNIKTLTVFDPTVSYNNITGEFDV